MCREAFVYGWVLNLANLSETSTLCQFIFDPGMFTHSVDTHGYSSVVNLWIWTGCG